MEIYFELFKIILKIYVVGGACTSWEAIKQTIALSRVEIAYMALSEAAKKALYLKNFMTRLCMSNIVIKNDSQGHNL